MLKTGKFFIDGQWVAPLSSEQFNLISPVTEKMSERIAAGRADDIDRAVAAAKGAFADFSLSTVAERIELLKSLKDVFSRRSGDIADLITMEMGAPVKTVAGQNKMALSGLDDLIALMATVKLETVENGMLILHEPLGVVGMITPWNAPINQIASKFFPALAAGCTAVVKPSEFSPLSPLLFAEIVAEAGVPKGVFNLVNGLGAEAGAALAAHPDVDMISFTGSVRTGAMIAKAGADTVKRVHQELGGKSPNVILDDADLEIAVKRGVQLCFNNSGQVCTSPTRMLVPAALQDEVVRLAREAAEAIQVGSPDNPETDMGPLVNELQFGRVQQMIESGISGGATLVTGGLGRPDGMEGGYFVKPTVFANVTPDMGIAREEIFGPVLSIIAYADEAEAIRIANDTVFGLAAHVQSRDVVRAERVGRSIRAGMVTLNYGQRHISAPFGGYKQSGNGRVFGIHGLNEYFEVKTIVGSSMAN